jgi:hypothetical protein
VLCPGKAYDRSPCGTGTSANLTCLHADGKIREGEIWRQESIVGSIFEGSIRVREGRVYPSIKGSAFVNAESELILTHETLSVWVFGVKFWSMNQGYDAVIVGAGVVGAACAYEFARRDLRVVIVDRDVVGSGATAAGMAHIVAMDDSDVQFALTRYSQRLCQALGPVLPKDVEYEQCGTIWAAGDEEEMAGVWRKQKYYITHGVPAEMLDPKTLKQLEPNLRDGMADGLLVPEGSCTHLVLLVFSSSGHKRAGRSFFWVHRLRRSETVKFVCRMGQGSAQRSG